MNEDSGGESNDHLQAEKPRLGPKEKEIAYSAHDEGRLTPPESQKAEEHVENPPTVHAVPSENPAVVTPPPSQEKIHFVPTQAFPSGSQKSTETAAEDGESNIHQQATQAFPSSTQTSTETGNEEGETNIYAQPTQEVRTGPADVSREVDVVNSSDKEEDDARADAGSPPKNEGDSNVSNEEEDPSGNRADKETGEDHAGSQAKIQEKNEGHSDVTKDEGYPTAQDEVANDEDATADEITNTQDDLFSQVTQRRSGETIDALCKRLLISKQLTDNEVKLQLAIREVKHFPPPSMKAPKVKKCVLVGPVGVGEVDNASGSNDVTTALGETGSKPVIPSDDRTPDETKVDHDVAQSRHM